MLRQFLRHGLIYGLSLGLSGGLSVALLPVYTRRLQAAELGAFDLLQAVTVLANIVIPLEIILAIWRIYPEEPSPERRRTLTATAWWFTVFVYTVAALSLLPLQGRLGPVLLGELHSARTSLLAVAAVWTSGLAYYCGNEFRWQMQPGGFAAFNAGRALLTHGVAVLLTVGADAGLAGVMTGHIVGNAVPMLVCAWRSRHDYRRRPDLKTLGELLRFSSPMVPASLAIFLTTWIDRVAISRMMSLGDVGRYGIGLRFASVVTLVATGFQQALMPIVFQRHQQPETPAQLARLFRGAVCLSLAVVLFLDLFVRDLLRLLVAKDFRDVDGIVSLLAAAACATSLATFAPGLMIARKSGRTGLIYAAGAGTMTLLNLALIPRFGLTGAALATLGGSVLTLVLFLRASQASYPVPHEFGRLLGWASVAFLIIALHHALPPSLGASPGASLALRLVAGSGGTALLVWGLVLRRSPKPETVAAPVPAGQSRAA